MSGNGRAGSASLARRAPAKERKSDRTRRRILEAAANVLSRNGFAGTRVSEIAELAGLQVPAIYYYFESREALLQEVVLIGTRRAMENVTARLAALPAEAGPMDRLCAAFGAHLEMVLEKPDYTTAATRTYGQLPPEISAPQMRQQRKYGALWRKLIAEGIAAGEVDPYLDPGAARMLLIGAMNWVPEWYNPARGTPEDLVETAKRLVRNALSPRQC